MIFIILIIIGGVYLKMKYDEREKQKEIYYKEQQERIILYLKYNTKEPNTIKVIHFTKYGTTPMGSTTIEGYINNQTKNTFSALNSPENNYQFQGDMTLSQELYNLLKPAHERKSPDEIKKELDKKKLVYTRFKKTKLRG
ncbi:DUF1433 domain-containing protein [Staphylococcus aureus]|uniref:DUF1433 domain-containing protein n=1 Tax=Staphylococcus aureus TaxID=1280 RepID=UPI0018EC44D0|nr:DUF1433 domain-containing protein [Staphylococcus aureus]